MSTTKKSRVYRLEPAGVLDITDPRVVQHEGAEVQIIQPHGCPRNGTFGQVYVQTVEGDFIGLVNQASLVKTNYTAVVVDKAAEARDARSRRLR